MCFFFLFFLAPGCMRYAYWRMRYDYWRLRFFFLSHLFVLPYPLSPTLARLYSAGCCCQGNNTLCQCLHTSDCFIKKYLASRSLLFFMEGGCYFPINVLLHFLFLDVAQNKTFVCKSICVLGQVQAKKTWTCSFFQLVLFSLYRLAPSSQYLISNSWVSTLQMFVVTVIPDVSVCILQSVWMFY